MENDTISNEINLIRTIENIFQFQIDESLNNISCFYHIIQSLIYIQFCHKITHNSNNLNTFSLLSNRLNSRRINITTILIGRGLNYNEIIDEVLRIFNGVHQSIPLPQD